MILCDREIKEANFIKPFREEQLTPNGYDMSVKKLDGDDWGICSLKGVIALTVEWVNMPPDVVGRPFIKTKWARKGLILSPGSIDAGFKGNLNFYIFNSSEKFVGIHQGDKIVQVLFDKIEKPEKLYAERSGHYQNQDKVIR